MKKWSLLLIVVCLSSCGAAFASDQLPPGRYLYLGTVPGKSPVKPLVVSPEGNIIWLDDQNEPITTSPVMDFPKPVVGTAPQAQSFAHLSIGGNQSVAMPVQDSSPFETYRYPLIKWKPRFVSGIDGAIAQLTTTKYDTAYVKFQLKVFKLPAEPLSAQIEILDKDGFKVGSLQAYHFQQIPGTTVFEAKGEGMLSDQSYRRAFDYTVSASCKNNYGGIRRF
ncbi:MAG: hypothetical protein AB7W16_24185 [Candidatus Obscuribacterales bacterium]